ncbi:MAG: hypothetical protein P1U84_15960 [Parvibaculaceae bacterium]|nr:hypothetical protein [Parvibaculaceae bacterium]
MARRAAGLLVPVFVTVIFEAAFFAPGLGGMGGGALSAVGAEGAAGAADPADALPPAGAWCGEAGFAAVFAADGALAPPDVTGGRPDPGSCRRPNMN